MLVLAGPFRCLRPLGLLYIYHGNHRNHHRHDDDDHHRHHHHERRIEADWRPVELFCSGGRLGGLAPSQDYYLIFMTMMMTINALQCDHYAEMEKRADTADISVLIFLWLC